MHQQVNADPRPPSEANPRVSGALDALVLQMLAKSPADRPQTAAEVRDRLRGAPPPQAARRAVPAPVIPAAETEATRAIGAPVRRSRVPTPPPPGPPWVRYAVIVLVIAVVALVAVLALASGGGPAPNDLQSRRQKRRHRRLGAPTSTTHSATTAPRTTTTTVTHTATATQPTSTATTTATTPARRRSARTGRHPPGPEKEHGPKKGG